MLLTNVRCPQEKGKQMKNALDVFSLLPFYYQLSLTDCAPPSQWQKKIKRLEEVAVWHLVKKIQKIRTKKHTAAGEGELLLANENVSTLSSKKIHSYTCNLGKMGH